MPNSTESHSNGVGCLAWALIIILCIVWFSPAPSWLRCVNCHCQTAQKTP